MTNKESLYNEYNFGMGEDPEREPIFGNDLTIPLCIKHIIVVIVFLNINFLLLLKITTATILMFYLITGDIPTAITTILGCLELILILNIIDFFNKEDLYNSGVYLGQEPKW
jgi:hypothetical protein